MFISLNGKKTEIKEGMTLKELIDEKGLEPERIVVEHNYQVLRQEEWEKTILKENDNLEVLRFVGGG
ncbi:MAG TPA: thiamine biosynthesis protein ThiS [Ruminiclostridium sp.]|uniref:Bifunctional sulfur carrier protein/thiazole synthase protein n=1 Tax=Acetivibrio saccincola TaxID=1677857 RepID=A0A2K9EPF1_9FIRM|nr:sulfur carrier protein ThiS [Acetivibrio saccincola]HAA42479.1 thiamine biosynthesis protein ThiS [Ruminiclostridium sp.]AUG57370.1 bifunctional sulfur carrier protein/thiazole synthase protein [Acetivibrio saccincola]NLW26524.1 sulfur carrier protein ThiS [Acetivibrio saccincola]PQQ67297.1 thiamine biosynthesis protein ThiS [Acetivibrio saccincola]HOA97482.1 sulfur carrier protein ThiS [Acetivibrio saccincola]